MPSAPNAQHVHVGVAHRFQQLAVFALLMRVGKLSAGIQLPPLAKTGTPLITKVKLLPDASGSCLSSNDRNPVRVVVFHQPACHQSAVVL
jgi:hypothetical protein